MIYFVTAREIGRVKIGHSQNPTKRFAKIQTDSPFPLVLERVCAGGESDEARLHVLFAEARINREWFGLTPEIEAHMETLPAPVGKGPSVAQLIMAATGLTKGTVSQILSDKYCNKLTIPICIAVYRNSGVRIGALLDAADHEIDTLEKFCGRFEKKGRAA